MRCSALLVLFGSTLAWPAWAAQRVLVEDNSRCLAVAAVTDGLRSRVAGSDPHEALSAFVVAEKSLSGRQLTLRLVVNRTGVVALERAFALKDEDCPHALGLLLAVLDTFFAETPRSVWEEPPAEPPKVEPPGAEPPAAPPTPVTSAPALWGAEAFVGVGSRWPSFGGDLELGGWWEAGSERNRLTLGLTLRSGLPRGLADGHFLESLGLLGVGWKHDAGPVWFHAELRAGALIVSGYGFPGESFTQPLFWLEGRAAVFKRWLGLDWGLELTAAPLADQASAEGQTAALSWLRFGLCVGLPWKGGAL